MRDWKARFWSKVSMDISRVRMDCQIKGGGSMK